MVDMFAWPEILNANSADCVPPAGTTSKRSHPIAKGSREKKRGKEAVILFATEYTETQRH